MHILTRHLSEVAPTQHGKTAEVLKLNGFLPVGEEKHDWGSSQQKCPRKGNRVRFRAVFNREGGEEKALKVKKRKVTKNRTKGDRTVEERASKEARKILHQRRTLASVINEWVLERKGKQWERTAKADRCSRTFCGPQAVTKETLE